MNSDDTVMSPELLNVYEGNLQAAIEWQAEISFKAGMQEVIKWIKSQEFYSNEQADSDFE